jgi:phosphatidylglycerophosphate synthase
MSLLQNLEEIKKTEKRLEWWTVIFIYKISSPLLCLIKDTPITPNHLTLASLAAVIMASLLIWAGNYRALLLAAVLIQVGLVFDNADGQLARLRKSTSQFGHWLDSTCDRIGELCLITSLTYRFSNINNYALLFGFYSLFLIYYFHGSEARFLPLSDPQEKKDVESQEGPRMKKIMALKNRLHWIPFNLGEQRFIFSLFLLLNRVDLFFYFFVSYGSLVTTIFIMYKHYLYRLALREKH